MNKLAFFFKRPPVVAIFGNGRACAKEAILQVLKPHFKIGRDILLLDANKECGFFLKRSKSPILLITRIGSYCSNKEFFRGNQKEAFQAEKLVSVLPDRGFLALNFDDESIRETKNNRFARSLTFGFASKADIRATDLVLTNLPNMGINFKINYQGSTVPVWLERTFGKEQIYSALAAAAAGEFLGLNLVEISEALKYYRSIPGKMRLIPGIKNSWVLDNSAGDSIFLTIEAIDVLGKIHLERGRKIAVLEIGKLASNNQKDVWEKAVKTTDLLFTVGKNEVLFTDEAFEKVMPENKVFRLDGAKEVSVALKKEIKENDLVLVDGSEEISMMDIVEEIKKGPIV